MSGQTGTHDIGGFVGIYFESMGGFVDAPLSVACLSESPALPMAPTKGVMVFFGQAAWFLSALLGNKRFGRVY